ncbi:hypothetical protein [Noviherbaspirillum aridicola]|nr:hypothetical protein [Noviherbaspirillum aridicola]
MEKRQSRSRPLNKAIPPVGGAPYNSPIKLSKKPKEPRLTREDISRAISIWAHLYRQCDEKSDPRDPFIPNRPWIGRDPTSIKRFE